MKNRFTISTAGKFINLASGKVERPPIGAMLGQRFLSTIIPASGEALDSEQFKQMLSTFARRKPEWQDGMSEDEKFYFATYRALSKSIINPHTVPIDFTKGNVLKAATPFLLNRPLMKDHIYSVDTQVGRVMDTVWDSTTKNDIPSGINALVRYNRLAEASKNIIPLVEAGDAYSVSVTVWFMWEKSHPELEAWDFYDALGTEVDGHMVRVVVTQVTDIPELSSVWDGADPDAERIAASKNSNGLFTFMSPVIGSIAADTSDDENVGAFTQPERENPMNEKLQKALAMVFGKKAEEITEQFASDVVAGVAELKDSPKVKLLVQEHETRAEAYGKKIEEKDAEIAALNVKVEGMKTGADLGEKFLASVRDEAAKFHKFIEGGDGDAVILEIIQEANLDRAIVLRDKYKKQAEEKAPLKCGKCNEPYTRSSSSEDTSGDQLEADENDGNQGSGPVIRF